WTAESRRPGDRRQRCFHSVRSRRGGRGAPGRPAYAAFMERREPAGIGDERTQLTEFLDFQRATVLMKVEGLDRAQLNQTTAATSLTLGGLLKHLAVVEDGWFRTVLLGAEPAEWYRHALDDPDWDFRTAADHEPAELV